MEYKGSAVLVTNISPSCTQAYFATTADASSSTSQTVAIAISVVAVALIMILVAIIVKQRLKRSRYSISPKVSHADQGEYNHASTKPRTTIMKQEVSNACMQACCTRIVFMFACSSQFYFN